MMGKKPGRGAEQFVLRLPEGMRHQIKEVAEDNGHSMNQEIINTLREYFPDPPSVSELLDDAQRLLKIVGDLESPKDRHILDSTLNGLILELQKRSGVKSRSKPWVLLSREALSHIDKISEASFLDRDTTADRLVKMGFEEFKRTWTLGTGAERTQFVRDILEEAQKDDPEERVPKARAVMRKPTGK